MDAHTYLSQVHARARSASTSSNTPSLVSYVESTSASDSTRGRSGSEGSESDSSVRPFGWKGLNTPMPLPSSVSATRSPTSAYDIDFIPDPSDPHSLR
jgi:serine palmitoyltransferase